MKNWNSVIYAIAGGLLYIISTALLPEWSHLLVTSRNSAIMPGFACSGIFDYLCSVIFLI